MVYRAYQTIVKEIPSAMLGDVVSTMTTRFSTASDNCYLKNTPRRICELPSIIDLLPDMFL